MNISPRTRTLLDRLPKDHPLSPSMKAAMIAALAAAEQFAGHKIALASNPEITERGQRRALRDALTGNHGKQWAKAKAAVQKARKAIEAERAALVIKPVDPANVAAALERQEIRAWVRTLDLGVRQSIVLSTKDRRILDAVVSAPSELSGFAGDAAFASKIEDRYIELTYPDKLASIEAKNAVVAEAEAGMGISYNELRSTVDMHQHDFSELMNPMIEAAAPSETHASPSASAASPAVAPKTTPDDSKSAAPEALFSPEEYKELWRPFDELIAGIAVRAPHKERNEQ
jgi:hypothetical protein